MTAEVVGDRTEYQEWQEQRQSGAPMLLVKLMRERAKQESGAAKLILLLEAARLERAAEECPIVNDERGLLEAWFHAHCIWCEVTGESLA